MTQQEFNSYKLAVAWRHIQKTRNLIQMMKPGYTYHQMKKYIKELLLLDSYTDILLEYTLPDSAETSENFLTPKSIKNIALKINYLTGLRYNYNFIKDAA
jgi:hypothetical protein